MRAHMRAPVVSSDRVLEMHSRAASLRSCTESMHSLYTVAAGAKDLCTGEQARSLASLRFLAAACSGRSPSAITACFTFTLHLRSYNT